MSVYLPVYMLGKSPWSEWLVLANSCVYAAQKLDLYQLLACNAYSPQETFVPILGKTVSSTVYEVMNMSCCIYESSLRPICSPVQQTYWTNSLCLSAAGHGTVWVAWWDSEEFACRSSISAKVPGTFCKPKSQYTILRPTRNHVKPAAILQKL